MKEIIKNTLKHINVHPRTMTMTKDDETVQKASIQTSH